MTSAREVPFEAPASEPGRGRLRGWLRRQADALRPGPLFWKGASFGALAAALLLMAYLAFSLSTGLGTAWDVLITVLVSAVVITLLILVILFVGRLIRAIPWFVVAAVLSAIAASLLIQSRIGVPLPVAILITIPVVLIEAVLGAALAAVVSGELRGAPALRKVVTLGLLCVAIALNVAGLVWLTRSGSTDHLVRVPAGRSDVRPLSAPDPGAPGSFRVRTLTYGSGSDRRRPEYGKSVAIKTATVDGTPLLKELAGPKAAIRQWYWGFGKDRLPINGRVWYPEGAGPFPLVLVVHGNHKMEEYSDPGYEYLGKLLASRGMIVVSVDENFLNLSWSGGLDRKETPARAWILLQHLKAWRTWNNAPANPFHRKVDLANVALIGHSRGGEAAAVAAAFNRLSHYPEDARVAFDFGFPIKSVVALAPTDDTYKPAGKPVVLENVNYLLLQGAHDADVSTFVGDRTYNRVKFTDDGYWFNSSLYIYRANHSQFNSAWGRYDLPVAFKSLLNVKPLLEGEEQRRIASLYISAFLSATLKGERAYLPMFRDYRVAAQWLPDTIYVSQFTDSTFAPVCDYEEDPDVTTTTLAGGVSAGEGLKTWREQRIPLRDRGALNRDNSAVYLGWDSKSKEGSSGAAPLYRISLPAATVEGAPLGSDAMLVFSLANRGDQSEAPDFTVELSTAGGETVRLPFSQFATVMPRLKVQTSKMSWLEAALVDPAEVVLQTYELPLAAFTKADPRFQPGQLKTITFRFDRSPAGEIALDRVGFRKG